MFSYWRRDSKAILCFPFQIGRVRSIVSELFKAIPARVDSFPGNVARSSIGQTSGPQKPRRRATESRASFRGQCDARMARMRPNAAEATIHKRFAQPWRATPSTARTRRKPKRAIGHTRFPSPHLLSTIIYRSFTEHQRLASPFARSWFS